jgi:hypothetical protein
VVEGRIQEGRNCGNFGEDGWQVATSKRSLAKERKRAAEDVRRATEKVNDLCAGVDTRDVKDEKKASGSGAQSSRRRPTIAPFSAHQRQESLITGAKPSVPPTYDLLRKSSPAPWASVGRARSPREALVSFHSLDALVSEADSPVP